MTDKIAAVLSESDNVVTNVLVADAATYPADPGCFLVDVDPQNVPAIGSTYDPVTQEFTPPVLTPVVPESVTPRQVRLLLLSQNLLSQIETTISQMDQATRITWEYAIEFRRNDILLLSLAEQLNLSSQQVDQFFIDASQL